MSLDSRLGLFFKAEVSASGRKLFDEAKVSITGGSDTTILVYVRASPPVKVLLQSEGVASTALTADCSCAAGRKSQFCKHVWAALLGAEEKFPDFLSSKRAIDKSVASESSEKKAPDTYQETAKRRASEYRKEQYQRQKTQAKSQKQEAKRRESYPRPDSFSPEIVASLAYFSLNGFPMEAGPSETTLAEAKRKLSRVFHPDKGGTHSEIVELNEHCEVLARFLGI